MFLSSASLCAAHAISWIAAMHLESEIGFCSVAASWMYSEFAQCLQVHDWTPDRYCHVGQPAGHSSSTGCCFKMHKYISFLLCLCRFFCPKGSCDNTALGRSTFFYQLCISSFFLIYFFLWNCPFSCVMRQKEQKIPLSFSNIPLSSLHVHLLSEMFSLGALANPSSWANVCSDLDHSCHSSLDYL